MTTRTTFAIVLLVIAASAAIGIYLYPQMPARVASHWNFQGQVNGHMPKFWGLFLLPIISAAMFLVFIIIPKIDPKKENIEKFRNYFNVFIVCIILFLFYVHILAIFYNLGFRFNLARFLAPAFAALLYCAGILMGHVQRNWTIGIRTPWTIESENVWNKTHKLGAKLFKIAAVLALFGVLLPEQAVWLILVPIMASAVYLAIFSYLEFRKEKNLQI